MAPAEECHNAWKQYFETDAWRHDAKNSMRAVSAIYFHWVSEKGDNTIKRPMMEVHFDRLNGISSSYQYYMIRQGEVLMRSYSCWCPACYNVAVAGPSTGTSLSSVYEVRGYVNAGNQLYEWRNASCRAKNGPEASSPDERARKHGHELATTGIKPNQWILVEAFNDEEDETWLGKTLPFGDFGRESCC